MLPNFIVIGAAKAGTTALHWYLAEHPAVFMTAVKDPAYFAYGVGTDGRLLWGNPDLHIFPVKTFERIRTPLRGCRQCRRHRRGLDDVSRMSPVGRPDPAAASSPRLLCSLRHPVDRAYSDYLMYLRIRGRRLDPVRDLTTTAVWAQPESHWMRVGRYYEQLSRYFDAFPRDQICVLLFDDLRRNPQKFVRDTYQFLDVDPAFQPDFATPHMAGGEPASLMLESLFTRGARSALSPGRPKEPRIGSGGSAAAPCVKPPDCRPM